MDNPFFLMSSRRYWSRLDTPPNTASVNFPRCSPLFLLYLPRTCWNSHVLHLGSALCPQICVSSRDSFVFPGTQDTDFWVWCTPTPAGPSCVHKLPPMTQPHVSSQPHPFSSIMITKHGKQPQEVSLNLVSYPL